MVYRGKPSKACSECRERKTRCDLKSPACGQCRRQGRKCSGYRNLQELRFVNQSSEVSSKLSKAQNEPLHPDSGYESAVKDSSSPSMASSSSEESTEIAMTRTFPEPSFWIEGSAKIAFFDQFINFDVGYLKTELQFVSTIHDSVRTDGMLESIISALGMAILHKGNQDIAYLADQKYSSALRQTQLALQNPKLAKADETLATVLLLGMHELVAVDEPDTDLVRSSVHVKGAVNLLQLRGPSQLSTNHGGRMFHRVYAQVFMACLHSRTRIPQSLLKLQRAARARMNSGETAAADMFELGARLCNISASIDETPDQISAVQTLQDLQAIDEATFYWKDTLDIYLAYQRVPICSPDKSFLTHQDRYINHLAGSAWNRYRCLRIRTNEEIIHVVSKPANRMSLRSYNIPELIAHAKSIIEEMSKGICQSVPFFLGQGSIYNWQETPTAPPKMYGSAAMLLPLYFASNPQFVSPNMREYLMGQIEKIAKETGIAKARSILEERELDVLHTAEI